MNPNLILIAVVFSLLLGSSFSQRARCLLAYFGVPTLCAFAVYRSVGFELNKEISFYAAYHADWRNQLVHIIFVPQLVATSMVFLAYVRRRRASTRAGHPRPRARPSPVLRRPLFPAGRRSSHWACRSTGRPSPLRAGHSTTSTRPP